ncbi:rho guanine nucleotide exchange factor 28 isoform X9 [Octopus bimaculoides]|nr:rho guanine nucleotide exchange factor 28 isoform X9 [Octopus bimaculoides]|eukprot:XP_014768587.1 PREDICTED: rho guanine nucleotide exchange factor 28-like isoform X7 [Octopus bimaculoides]
MPRAKKRSRQKKNKSAKAMLHLPSSGPNSHFVVGDGSQAKVGLEGCCMVFSPQESPVYGGDELVVTVDNLNLPAEAEFFILYTGSNERRVTRAQRINNLTFQANIPDHNLEELVDLDFFYRYEKEEVCYQRVANGQFRYCYDSAHRLAQQLLESKTDEESSKLAVENEDLSTLDVRLRKALEYIASTEGWPSDHCKSEGKPAACANLLFFAAHHGLPQVITLVLTEVGTDVIHITDSKEQTPRDVALSQGHNHIADLLISNTRTLMKSESMKFERDGVVVHRNRNGAISIATTNVHEDTVRGDMELLKSIEIDIAKEEQLDIECDQEDVIHLGKRDNEGEDIQTSVDKKYGDSFKNTPSLDENEEEKEKADSLKSTPEEEKISANILSTEDDAAIDVNINDHSINTEATKSVSALDVNTDSTAAAGNEVAEKESTLHIEEEDQDALTKQLGSATEASTSVVTTTDKIKTCDEMSSSNSHSESINCADTENENTELSAVAANQAGAVDHFLEEDLSSEASDEIIDFSTQETPLADVTTTSTTDATAISAETTACNNSDGSISPTKSTADSKIFDTGDVSSECTTSVVNDTELTISTSNEPSLVHETSAISESADAVDGLELNTPALTDVSTSKTCSSPTDPTEPTQMLSSSVTGAESSTVMPNFSTNEIESSTVISESPALESESNEIVCDSPDNELVTSNTMPESSTSESVTSTTVPDSSTSGPVTSTTNPDSSVSEDVTSTTMPESSTSESVTSSTMPDSVTTESLTSPASDSAAIESVTSIPVSQIPSVEAETIVSPESVSETDDVSNPPVTISDTAAKQFNTTSASDVATTVPHMSIDSSEASTVSTSQIPDTNPQPSITTPENIDTFSEGLSSVSISTPPISEIYSPADSTTTDTANTEPSLVITESTCSVCLSANCECEHPDILQVSHQTPTESTVPEKHAAPNTESILESESNAALTSVESSRENSEAAISSQPLSPLFKSQTTPSPPLSSPSPPPVPSTASAALTPPTPPVSAPPPEAVLGDCGSTNNTFSKAQQEAVSSDSPFQEYGTHRILKGEPLSNGHTISSLLNNNCDLGSLGVLDTLLEERETSEEPVEKSPMVLTSCSNKTVPVFAESIEAVRSISRHIQKLRNHGLGLGQNVKPDNLQRYRSCPILDAQDRCSSPSASEESVHHRSMLDLAPGVERQPVYSDAVFAPDLSGNLLNSGLYNDYGPACGAADVNDSGVRICINGVTVGNSSENLAVSTAPTTENSFTSAVSELVKSTAECVHGTEGRFVSAAGRDKEDFDPGPVSAGYGEHVGSGAHKEIRGHQRTHSEIPKSHRNLNYIRSTMASSLSGKSHSLNSLTGAEESDEDSFHDARENPTPSQSMMNLSTMPSDAIQGHQRSISSGDAYSSYGQSAYTDNKRPPSWPLTAMFDYRKIMENNSASLPSPDAVDSPDSVFVSNYPFPATPSVNFAKSSSTSCLPAARDGSKGVIPQMKRQHKQYYTQKLEDNEKFRRQQEFEEIDEVAEINKEAVEPRKNSDKKELAKNFHSMLISSSYSSLKDEKDKDKNEEKKKKSSNVLAKFGSTRKKFKKGKDGKEKENKHKNAHQFVSLSISNTSLCHVCNKSMANKAAVQCENCLINVHESSCKEHIPPCSKLNKSKATLQEGSNHGLREKQYPSAPVQSTKFLDSSKRSSSAPVWSLEGNLSQTWPDHRISEEREEYGSNRPESMHSNIGETISESMESLDEPDGMDQTVLESDPFLCMEENEPEAWSISVEKKVVKKLSSKEVKRQDHIYELVLTEKKYCQKLTIMQKIIFKRLFTEAGVSQECLNMMFPCLEELLAIHVSFFNNLQHLQSQNKDNIIDEIGKTLIDQFDGESSERIKNAYGYFCSHHKESANVYKDLITDRRVLSLVKRWSSNSLFAKREIPDFLLIVTHRLTKYPTMIESIVKHTKDKKDRDNLLLALEHIKDILTNVNSQVEEYECAQHLEEIIQRIEPRSSVSYRGRKFKRFDLSANCRKLIHEGEIGWKTSRGKVTDVTALVLTDLIVLMQENNQKYTFTMQDNKSCVIPLYELLVREKGDTKDCKGIYLISKRQTAPEMYELVCKSTEDMKSWINHLSYAVSQCPRDVPLEATQSFKKAEEQKIMEIRRQRIRLLFEKMKSLDQEIIKCCDDKKGLLVQYAELLSHDDGAPTIVSSSPNTSTLSSASTNLAEAMEKHPLKDDGLENEYLQYALKENPGQKRPHSYVNQECRSASMFNLHESDSSGSKDSMKINNRKSTGYIQSMVTKHHTLDSTDTNNQPVNLAGMALVSCIDLPPVPSNSDTSAVLTPPPTALDQNTAQIYHFLHSFLQLSSQQNTTIEDLRIQLAEAREIICKMNAEKLEINKHSQLEGLRNLKEELMREREEFELEKKRNRENQERDTVQLQKEKDDLKLQQEELRRGQVTLQKQIDLFMERRSDSEGRRQLDRTENPEQTGPDGDNYCSSIQHTRSASVELAFQSSEDYKDLKDSSKPVPKSSVGNLVNSPGNKTCAPHLFSATNEQRSGEKLQQFLPLKFVDNLSSSLPNSKGASQSQHRTGLGRSVSSSSFSTGKDPSSLSQVMKLAEPSRSAHKERPTNHPPPVQPKSEPTETDIIYF